MTERLTDEALLPCPFCGGEAEWVHGAYGDGARWSYIACQECEAMGPAVAREGWTQEQAITAWNRRATPADDLRAALTDLYQCDEWGAFSCDEVKDRVRPLLAALSHPAPAPQPADDPLPEKPSFMDFAMRSPWNGGAA